MKKRAFAVALVVCLIAVLGFGTLAYFQASGDLLNKFFVAGYDPNNPDVPVDPETLFSIKVDEEDILNGGRTEDGNTYTDLMPGMTLKKDPTITNTGKYDAYVRVIITVTNANAWQTACAKHGITDLADIFNGYVDADWTRDPAEDKADATADTITYTYYYNASVAPGASATLFDSLTIPEQFDVYDMSSLTKWELQIVGEAIQSKNIEAANAQEAFGLWK